MSTAAELAAKMSGVAAGGTPLMSSGRRGPWPGEPNNNVSENAIVGMKITWDTKIKARYQNKDYEFEGFAVGFDYIHTNDEGQELPWFGSYMNIPYDFDAVPDGDGSPGNGGIRWKFEAERGRLLGMVKALSDIDLFRSDPVTTLENMKDEIEAAFAGGTPIMAEVFCEFRSWESNKVDQNGNRKSGLEKTDFIHSAVLPA